MSLFVQSQKFLDFINIDFTKMSQVTEFAEICDHFDVLILI